MQMNRQIALAAVAAGTTSLLAAFGLYRHNIAAQNAAAARAHGLHYLVTLAAIPQGTRVVPGDLQTKDWPSDQPVDGAVTDRKVIAGRFATVPIPKGAVLSEAYLSAPGAIGGMTGRIPVGYRAIAIKASDTNDLAGFLLPGSHVDIVCAWKVLGIKGQPIARPLVQDVQVLATGTQMVANPEGKPTVESIVTILLTPEDARRVELAQENGTLSVLLRNGDDREVMEPAATELSDLTGKQPEADRPGQAQPERVVRAPRVRRSPDRPAPASSSVQVMFGASGNSGAVATTSYFHDGVPAAAPDDRRTVVAPTQTQENGDPK